MPNVVTAELADYRGYDTMFETIVIFASGVACLLLLRVLAAPKPEEVYYRHIPSGITLRIKSRRGLPEDSKEFERIDLMWVPYDLVIKTSARLIVPFSQLFALYVIAHGHHSRGGGFQGGVIMGASIILFAISNNLRMSVTSFSEKRAVVLCVLGVLIYVTTGILCIVLDANYLDYGALAFIFRIDSVSARSLGILIVEIGVAITVTAVMVILYYNLASAGRYDEGL